MYFSRGRRVAAVCARFVIYLVRWLIEPMKLLSSLKVLGSDHFSIASVFSVSGLVPSLLMSKSNHSTCLQANLHLSREIARFSSSSFVSTVWSFWRCVSMVPFVTIRISSRYA